MTSQTEPAAVLVVDSGAAVGLSVARFLRRHNFRVEVVTTAGQGLACLHGGRPSLVLVHDTGAVTRHEAQLLKRAPGTTACAMLRGASARGAAQREAVPGGLPVLELPLDISALLALAGAAAGTSAGALESRDQRTTARALPMLIDQPLGWSVRGEFDMDLRPTPEPSAAPRHEPERYLRTEPARPEPDRDTLRYLPAVTV